MKHGKSKVNSQNTLKTVKKKQSDLIRTRGKQIYFAPATWADHLSNFFVFITQNSTYIYHYHHHIKQHNT